MSSVVAILLAAGRSERMGAFKPLLPFGNTTVIRSCVENLRGAGLEDIVVVLGHRAVELQRNLGNLRMQFALNSDATSEMSASIGCGLREIPPDTSAVLIALSDQPAIPPAVIRSIVTMWKCGEKLVVPEFQGRGGHPVLIDLCFREELLHLDSGQGLKSFFDVHKEQVLRLSVSSPFIAQDMDTWDDYLSLHEEIFGILPVLGPG